MNRLAKTFALVLSGLLITAGLAMPAHAGACHKGFCVKRPYQARGYSRADLFAVYKLMKLRPELVQQHPALFARLDAVFGATPPAPEGVPPQAAPNAVVQPAVPNQPAEPVPSQPAPEAAPPQNAAPPATPPAADGPLEAEDPDGIPEDLPTDAIGDVTGTPNLLTELRAAAAAPVAAE
ncbi:MAG: hypothetical protein ACREJB_08600 [Planctomycetaceae bacterium]